MQFTILQLLIICPLVFLSGFVDAIAGGGGLVSIPAYLLAGFPPIVASGTNKISANMGCAVSFTTYLKKGFINSSIAIPCVITAILGSSIGATIATKLSQDLLRMIVLVLLPIIFIITMKKDTFISNDNIEENVVFDNIIKVKCAIISFFIGMYDGFYGPGTGTFLIILFSKLVKLDIKRANGITKAINLSTGVSALIVYVITGKALIVLGLIAGCFNMLGGYIGANLFSKSGAKIARPIILIVIAIFMIKTILELV